MHEYPTFGFSKSCTPNFELVYHDCRKFCRVILGTNAYPALCNVSMILICESLSQRRHDYELYSQFCYIILDTRKDRTINLTEHMSPVLRIFCVYNTPEDLGAVTYSLITHPLLIRKRNLRLL